ncbi:MULTISPECIES: hypothetical protein [unclassified Janthinobacterium]|uniref:hypothetical protein n=1 Tax=unclassified Janthinobacterium TaxID=2610881 RepID=UPI0011134091|nr:MULTISPECIES: hypothetical protein [unclassified Janthinobacterium]
MATFSYKGGKTLGVAPMAAVKASMKKSAAKGHIEYLDVKVHHTMIKADSIKIITNAPTVNDFFKIADKKKLTYDES